MLQLEAQGSLRRKVTPGVMSGIAHCLQLHPKPQQLGQINGQLVQPLLP